MGSKHCSVCGATLTHQERKMNHEYDLEPDDWICRACDDDAVDSDDAEDGT